MPANESGSHDEESLTADFPVPSETQDDDRDLLFDSDGDVEIGYAGEDDPPTTHENVAIARDEDDTLTAPKAWYRSDVFESFAGMPDD